MQHGRSRSEFNKYEAIDNLETHQNASRDNQNEKSKFYHLVYQAAKGKVNLPKEHFRALVLRHLGDKDHTKVYEAVAKVENAMGTGGVSLWAQQRCSVQGAWYKQGSSQKLLLSKVRPHYVEVLCEEGFAAKAPLELNRNKASFLVAEIRIHPLS